MLHSGTGNWLQTLPESPFVSPCECTCAIVCDCSCIDKSMQIVLERDSIDKPSDFLHLSATTNFSCKGVFNQNIWGQILLRVCTLVLFIIGALRIWLTEQ